MTNTKNLNHLRKYFDMANMTLAMYEKLEECEAVDTDTAKKFVFHFNKIMETLTNATKTILEDDAQPAPSQPEDNSATWDEDKTLHGHPEEPIQTQEKHIPTDNIDFNIKEAIQNLF